MSYGPVRPSPYWLKHGFKPIYAWGHVLWLHPDTYAQMADTLNAEFPDATEEQIAAQDAWYEREQEENRREAEHLRRLFTLMEQPVVEDVP